VPSIHRLSLFTRLLASFVLVVTIAFAVEAWLIIRTGERDIDALIVETLSTEARDRFGAVDQFLGDRAAEIQSWSRLSVMDDVLVQDRVLDIENFLLERHRKRPQLYVMLSVLDRSETVVASTDLKDLGHAVSIATLAPAVETGSATRWSALPADPATTPAVLRIAHPITSSLSREPIGWLVASINWDAIERMVVTSRDGTPVDGDKFFQLVGATGRVVAGDRLRTNAAGESSIGDDYLVVTRHAPEGAPLPSRNLAVVAGWNKRSAFDVLRSFVAVVLGSTLLGALLATGVSFAIARYITGRLGKLIEGTRLLAQGELSYRVEEGPDDEFGQLTRAFNVMGGELIRARDGLEAAVARWKALVTHAPDVILTVARDGTIVFINRVVSGLTVDQVVGTNVVRYAAPGHGPALRAAIDRVFLTGEPEGLELEGTGPDGRSAWYASRIGPVQRDAEVIAVTIVTTDITERKRLEKEVLEIAEFERARIGQDLHDGLGQSLTGIALLSRGLEQRLAEHVPRLADEAREIGALINETIGQTRRLAEGLFPSVLETSGLRGALEELVAGVERTYGIRCRFRMADAAVPKDQSWTTHLFRIIQEATNNAVRHGKAKRILIVLGRSGPGNVLAIFDDGVGFPDEAARTEGIGLRSMRYRASVMGGALELRRRRRGGVIVACRFS